MDFTKLSSINLIGGSGGGDPKAGLCIMEMVSWFDGADMVTDRPECACPLLTTVAICINDKAPSQELRNTLKPLLPMLSGSKDEESRKARAWFVMRESAVRILAVRLDRIAAKVPPELAANIRAAGDPATMHGAVSKAGEWLKANAYAYAYAYADAYAYAYAYANAKIRTADRVWVFETMRGILTEALAMGKHGCLDMDAPETEARADRLLEIVAA